MLGERVVVDSFVHGGQAIGTLNSGKKVFAWGALPGEEVEIELFRNKKDWCEGYTTSVIKPSSDRIEPLEPPYYLSTSPWQILDFAKEPIYKQQILAEAFKAEKAECSFDEFANPTNRYGYRNKMEYNFWWDNDAQAVSLALHRRGSHQKIPVVTSALASDAINDAGIKIIEHINQKGIQARQLKSVILRSNTAGAVVACLYVIDKTLVDFDLDSLCIAGLQVYYSNPKSPASVKTEILATYGAKELTDKILGNDYSYAPDGFFQINLAMYEVALNDMARYIDTTLPTLDLYSGVGTIGMSIGGSGEVECVELDASCVEQARTNAIGRSNIKVIYAASEKALEYISRDKNLIVDPPRAGLHKDVVAKIITEMPKRVVYLSCNPSTQARDIALLVAGGYTVEFARGYNFFPATPHIECLVVLTNDRVGT